MKKYMIITHTDLNIIGAIIVGGRLFKKISYKQLIKLKKIQK